jgi:hopanoid biosynthesis associated RND transporter like protein HpnN
MHKGYSYFVGIIVRHPVSVVLAAMMGAILSLLVTATRLEFHTSRLDLISSGERYRQLDQAYSREFEDLPDGVIVAIRSDHPETAKAFATALGQRWQTDPTIDKVWYRIDVEALKRKALFYLSPDELAALRQKLQEHRDLLQELVAAPTLQHLFALINREVTAKLVGHVFTGFLEEGKKEPPDLSLLLALLQEMQQWLEGRRIYRSPWEQWFAQNAEAFSHDGFLWSEDKHLLFVLADPKAQAGDFNRFKVAVQRMRADVRALQQAYPEVEVGVTGRAVLDADEMGEAQRDTAIATVIALVGVTLLYFGLFKSVIRPLLALAVLGIALCWSFGLTTLTIGHLNILTIVFTPLLVGLGIDYGSYFIARYEEERAGGRGLQEALTETLITTGPGIATTALTTAFTFGALLLTDFKGVAELGFIGGSGILLAAVATFTVLPALMVLDERRRPVGTTSRGRLQAGTRGGYLEPLYRHPRAILAASALLVGLSLLTLGRVGADFNLLHLKAEGTESVIWLQRMFESTKRSVLFGELVAQSLEEVRRKAAALKALPSVAQVESLASVLPEDQERKLPLIRALRPFLTDLALQPDRAGPVDLTALRVTLGRIQFKMVEEEGTWEAQDEVLQQQMRRVRRLIDQFVGMTERMGNAAALQALSGFQEELFRDLGEKLAVLQANLKAEPVTLTDLPPALRTRYIGKTGKFRLFAFPAQDIWEFHPLARFVADLKTVDPEALGTPVMNFEYLRSMKEAYEQAGLYAFLGIVVLAIVTFRAVRPALLALIPLAVGSLWTLGLMGLFQLKFNVANLLVLPLIMAPAVESGIMIVYRACVEGRRSLVPLPRSTGRAVVFSASSTIVGFGSLMISHHRGIFSIGLLLALGVGSVLLASVTVLPSLLALLASKRGGKADMPAGRGNVSDVRPLVGADLAPHPGPPGDRRVLSWKPERRGAVGADTTTGTDGNSGRGMPRR